MEKDDRSVQTRKPTQVRRVEIIEAGMRILSSEGARRFTTNRLGRAVGITGGTIFRNFGSMDEILDAIVDRIEEIIFADFPPRAEDPLESLRQFFEARVNVIANQPEISKLLTTDALIPNANADHRQQRLREFKRRSQHFVTDCLKGALAGGLLAKGVNPEEAGILVLGSIHAIGHMGGRARKPKDIRGTAHRSWVMIERALRKDD